MLQEAPGCPHAGGGVVDEPSAHSEGAGFRRERFALQPISAVAIVTAEGFARPRIDAVCRRHRRDRWLGHSFDPAFACWVQASRRDSIYHPPLWLGRTCRRRSGRSLLRFEGRIRIWREPAGEGKGPLFLRRLFDRRFRVKLCIVRDTLVVVREYPNYSRSGLHHRLVLLRGTSHSARTPTCSCPHWRPYHRRVGAAFDDKQGENKEAGNKSPSVTAWRSPKLVLCDGINSPFKVITLLMPPVFVFS